MSMRVVYHAQDRFELAIGPVRLDLEPRDLLKLKTLIDRSVHVYADQLRDDRDEPPPGDAEAPPEPDAFP